MKFSVCIPVYNAQNYNSICIDSILRQSFTDYEIVIVNDGSTDNSGDLCEKYSQNHECIRVIHQENKGLMTTRSVLVQNARGEYCVFVDADDYISVNALEILDGLLVKYDKPDCIIFGLARVLYGKRVNITADPATELMTDKYELYRRVLSSDSYNSVCRKCTKTDILQLFDEKPCADIHMGEDLLRSLMIYKNCQRVLFASDVLYSYVVNETSMIHTVTPLNFQPSYLLYRHVHRFLAAEGISESACGTEIRTLYAQKLVRDVLQIARFTCDYRSKLQFVGDVAVHSEAILNKQININSLGRRKMIYHSLQHGKYKQALIGARIENMFGEMSARIRRLAIRRH